MAVAAKTSPTRADSLAVILNPRKAFTNTSVATDISPLETVAKSSAVEEDSIISAAVKPACPMIVNPSATSDAENSVETPNSLILSFIFSTSSAAAFVIPLIFEIVASKSIAVLPAYVNAPPSANDKGANLLLIVPSCEDISLQLSDISFQGASAIARLKLDISFSAFSNSNVVFCNLRSALPSCSFILIRFFSDSAISSAVASTDDVNSLCAFSAASTRFLASSTC